MKFQVSRRSWSSPVQELRRGRESLNHFLMNKIRKGAEAATSLSSLLIQMRTVMMTSTTTMMIVSTSTTPGSWLKQVLSLSNKAVQFRVSVLFRLFESVLLRPSALFRLYVLFRPSVLFRLSAPRTTSFPRIPFLSLSFFF